MNKDEKFDLPDIDWTKPDMVTEDNKRVFSVRCRVPFSNHQPNLSERVPRIPSSANAVDLSETAKEMGVSGFERVIIDDGDGILLPDDATGDLGSDDEVDWGDLPLLSGIASSTSVDFYGTEMSLRALKQMAIQMMGTNGVPYLPRHNNGASGSLEWDEVIGRTIHAEVVPAEEVRKSYNPVETQFILRVTTEIYADEDKSQALIRRLERGEEIGQSIGGWFTNLNVIQNDEGDVERVIVQGVELDHLAVTRAPANPDSIGLVSLRSKFQEQANESLTREVRIPTVEAVRFRSTKAERHIVDWQPHEDGTITIRYVVEENMEEVEEEGKGKKKKYSTERASLFADLPMAPVETEWSFTADDADKVLFDERMEGDPDWDRYKAAHAYYDEDNSSVKSSYKLPIAKMIEGELHVVWRGVVAAMAALNGARGGVDLNEDAREEAYDVLIEYYGKFEKEPPELKSIEFSGIDNERNSEQDVTIDDAGTSASDTTTFNNSTKNDTVNSSVLASEEISMDSEQVQEAFRSLLKDELAPLVERVNSLEVANGETTETTTVANTIDERVVAAEAKANEAIARAEAAEKRLNTVSRQPVRVGRAVSPTADSPAPTHEYQAVISDARSSAPSLAAVAEQNVSVITEADGVPTRRKLEQTLRSILLAAEKDGIIVNPDSRNSW